MAESFARRYFHRAVAEDRLAHAYVLWGPDAAARDGAAHDIARSLVCQEGPREDRGPCGSCRPCREAAASVHAGYMELSGDEPAIEIEAIRELAQRLAIAYEGRRVVFVPGLDRLTLPAANAFLKILEEPGGSTVYVMTSGRTANLLPTILSRCHRLPLFPARAAESAPALDIDALLAQPDALERMDLADLLEPFGGRDKRERFEALLAYSAGRIEARIAELLDGASAGAPGAWLAGLPLDDVLCLAEEILELADDATWNVNTDLMLEAFAAAIRRAGRVA